MTESRITTWQQPDDLWAFRLEEPCGPCGGSGNELVEFVHPFNRRSMEPSGRICWDCHGDGIVVAYSQHGFRTRELALVRARQVALERTREPRRYEETVELEGT